MDPVTNFAKANVSLGYLAAAVSIVLETGGGALFPAPATAGAFNLVWWNWTDYRDPALDPLKEIIRCTARTADTLTITRAQEGTTATNKNIAGKIYCVALVLTKKMYDDLATQTNKLIGTNVTAANLNTLTGGVASNADLLHKHSQYGVTYEASASVYLYGPTGQAYIGQSIPYINVFEKTSLVTGTFRVAAGIGNSGYSVGGKWYKNGVDLAIGLSGNVAVVPGDKVQFYMGNTNQGSPYYTGLYIGAVVTALS